MVQRTKLPDTTPTLIIFDEAHHATATTWRNITDHHPSAFIVGLTATPKRTNGQSLSSDLIYYARVLMLIGLYATII